MITIERGDFLWETGDWAAALELRFGWATLPAAVATLTDIVYTNYGLEIQRIERLAISAANAVVWLATDGGRFILKLCANHKYHSWLAARTNLVVWLGAQDFPVAKIMSSKGHTYQIAMASYSVSLQQMVDGEHLDATNLSQAKQAGAALARLHQTWAQYPALPDFAPAVSSTDLLRADVLQTCDDLAMWLDTLADDHTALLETLNRIKHRWATSDLQALPQGLCHHDFRAANLLFKDDELRAVLDFEDVRWGFWVRDLAWATVHLGTLFRDWGLVAPATEAAFVVGYTTHRSLIEAEHTILPTLLALDTISLARATNDEAQRRISLERARNLAFTLD